MRKIAGCRHVRLGKIREKSENTGIFGTSPGQYQTISHGNRKEKVIGYDGENERYENRQNGRGIILEKKKRDRAKEKKD